MIQVSRSERVAVVRGKAIVMKQQPYELLTVLGMLGRMEVEPEFLMDLVLENPVRVPSDRFVLTVRLSRLRKKLGRNFIKCRKGMGYRVTEEIRFVG